MTKTPKAKRTDEKKGIILLPGQPTNKIKKPPSTKKEKDD